MLMLIIIGLTYPPIISFKFELQSATGFTKCNRTFHKPKCPGFRNTELFARGEYLDVYVQPILDVKNNNNTKNKQTNKNQTKQNNRKKVKPICTRAVTIGDSSFASLDPKTLLRMTAREGVRSVSTVVEKGHAPAMWFRVTVLSSPSQKLVS